jgi:phospholipid/cholesterol/gamma-HCH transport system ATP-binding protein
VIVDGRNVPELKPAELKDLRANFGILFQNGALLQWMSVADNVALPLREHTTLPEAEIQKRVQHALTLVNMQHDGAKFPSNISGGMQKRAGLARAIIRQPKIVLYDEPTSGLDPIMSNQINELVLDMQAKLGITSVVVTHDMESAYMIADQIAVIYKGEIIQTGTPDEIRNTKDPRVKQFITGSTRGPMTDSPEGMTSGKAVGAQ